MPNFTLRVNANFCNYIIMISTKAKYVLTLCLLLQALPNTSYGMESHGGDSSGGSQGIFYKDGTVDLLDLTSSRDFPVAPLNWGEIKKIILESERNPSRIGTQSNNALSFFECGIRAIERHSTFHRFESVRNGIQKLRDNTPQVFFYKGRLINTAVNENTLRNIRAIEASSWPIATRPSPSASHTLQTPIAIYNLGRIWISEIVYNRLRNNTHRCAVQVHEIIRHFNTFSVTRLPLTTPEIEAVTRNIFGVSLPEISARTLNSAFSKFEDEEIVNENDVRTLLQRIEHLYQQKAQIRSQISRGLIENSIENRRRINSLETEMRNTQRRVDELNRQLNRNWIATVDRRFNLDKAKETGRNPLIDGMWVYALEKQLSQRKRNGWNLFDFW